MHDNQILDNGAKEKKRLSIKFWVPVFSLLTFIFGVCWHILHYPFNGMIIAFAIASLFSYGLINLIRRNRSKTIVIWLFISVIFLIAVTLYFSHIMMVVWFMIFCVVMSCMFLILIKRKLDMEL